MVKSRVNKVIDEPYDGPSYRVKGRSIDCEFTPNHKFVLDSRPNSKGVSEQFYTTIKEIHSDRKKYSHVTIPKTAEWEGRDTEKVVISKIENSRGKDCSKDLEIDTMKFVSFLGIYLAEGYLGKGYRINICQKNECGKELIKNMLVNFHPEVEWKECRDGFYTTDARLYNYLIPLGDVYNKYVPVEIKNLASKYLEELIHWFAIGDGRALSCSANEKSSSCKSELKGLDVGKYGRLGVFSTSKKLIDDLHECLIKTGRCGTRQEIITEKDYIFAERVIKAKNKKPLYQLDVSRSKGIYLDTRFLQITEKHHTGRIYCLSTEHGNFYMKKDGHSWFCGNSDSIVHLSNCSHVITKLWWQDNTLMGEGEVLNTPSGKVLKSLIESGVRVGISSRGVGNGTTNEDGVLVISENYKLITFDAVADPSTYSAFQQKVGKKEMKESIKKTKLDPEVFISYLDQIFKKKINENKLI